MTGGFLKADPEGWKHDLAAYRDARAAIEIHEHKSNPDATDALVDRCHAAEDKVMGQPAPDIPAVVEKLLILWEDGLQSHLDESDQMRMIIGDLRRLSGQA